MNFYKHYIGDFQRDTGHLSLTERGAYLALIHHYYATERPLPNDHAALCRIAGAIDKAERAAVRAVMAFFIPVESGLMHKRIEAEIEKSGRVADTNREIALAREAKRRAERQARSDHDQSTNRAQNVERTDQIQSTHQTPDTKQQEINGACTPEPDGLLSVNWKPGEVATTRLAMNGVPVPAADVVLEFIAHQRERAVPEPLGGWDEAFVKWAVRHKRYGEERAARAGADGKVSRISAHANLDSKDYREGVAADGRF